MSEQNRPQVVWAVLYVREYYAPVTIALYDNEEEARAHLAAEVCIAGFCPDDYKVDSFVIYSSFQEYEKCAREASLLDVQ